jgi:hypothetical protein
VTVQIDVSQNVQPAAQAIELRWRNLREDLAGQGAPAEHLEGIDDALQTPVEAAASACRYLVVGGDGVVADEVLQRSVSGENWAKFSELPYFAALVTDGAHDLPYLVVEAGRDGARVTAFRASGRPVAVDEVVGETAHLSKSPGGGWAHRRFQQTTEEVWRRNAQEVAEDVERAREQASAQLIVLSGDVRAREQLAAQLPDEVRSQLVELDVHTRAAGSDGSAVQDAVAGQLAEIAAEERGRAPHRVGVGKAEGLAVAGVGETVHALRQAQVDVLLVDFDTLGDRTLLALKEEPWLATAPEEVTGTAVLTEAPAAEVLLRAGALTDASLLPLAAEEVGGDDGVAALLRWPIGPR